MNGLSRFNVLALISAIILLDSILVSTLSAALQDGDEPLIVINEVMASNNQTLADPQGQYDDWIELYNPGDTPVDIGGMYLTDDPDDPTKWQVPTDMAALTTIAPKGYLLIWADDDTDDQGLHAGFKLSANGDQVGLFDADGVTLIHSISFDALDVDTSFGYFPDGDGQPRPISSPTPGTANAIEFEGFVADLKFSHTRGFYDAPFELAITCDTPGVEIYYTRDGTEPLDDSGRVPLGTRYTGPFYILDSQCIRARAARTDWRPSPIATHTYLFISDIVNQSFNGSRPDVSWPTGNVNGQVIDYGMDPDIVNDAEYGDLMDDALLAIPSISLVTDLKNLFDPQTGIYVNAGREGRQWERPVSVELIQPEGRKGFQIDAGFRIRGGFSRSSGNPKHSFRLFFRSDYGQAKLNFPLFGDEGAEEFDNLDLRTAQNYAWSLDSSNPGEKNTFVREVFCRDLQRETDQPYTRSRFYHLYLNGQYWGLYQSQERSEASYAQTYFGDDSENYDVIKADNYQTSFTDGSTDQWFTLWELCEQGFAADASYYAVQGKRPDGTDDPSLPVHVDLENLIDYMLGIFYTGNDDAPVTLGGNQANNFFAIRNRRLDARDGWKFFAYDCEHSLGVRTGLYDDRTQMVSAGQSRNHFNPQWLHQKLMEHPEYRIRFADRTYKYFFNNGAMTPENAAALCSSRALEIDQAIIAESARWGDQRPGRTNNPYTKAHWWAEVNGYLLETYFPVRTNIVLNQLRQRGLYPAVEVPAFYVNGVYQHGGAISSSDNVSMTANSGTVWYTVDGSDPRLPGTSAEPGQTSTLVSEGAGKKVLIPTGPVDDTWRGGAAFDDSGWISGLGGVGFEISTGYESFFNIDVRNSMYATNASCYLRIPFEISEEDLATASSLTLKVRYDDGFIAYLNGVEVQRATFSGTPSWNSSADGSHSDLDAIELVPFDISDSLDVLHTGLNMLAIHGLNISTTSSDFLISVEMVSAEGPAGGVPGGVSPTALAYASPVTFDVSTQVKARALSGTTWSALHDTVFSVGPVADSLRITEIMYHPAESGNPDDPNTEFIELTNIGAEAINLNLVRFSNGVDFTFGDYALNPGAYVLAVKDVDAFSAKYGPNLPIAGQYTGSLDNGGERIELQDAAGRTIHDFRFQDGWYGLTDGMDFSLTVKDLATVDLDTKSAWRPSAEAGGSPGFDDSGLVPELGAVVINEVMANPEDGQSDWIELHNTTDQAISLAGWFLSDDIDDLTQYEIPANVTIASNGYIVLLEQTHLPFGLSRDGETLYLHSGSGGALAGYTEQETFGASEAGVSMGRYLKSTGTYNFVAMSEPTRGAANAEPKVGPIVISEIMYHPVESSDAEYIELLNISDADVTLYDTDQGIPWRLTADTDSSEIEYRFPAEVPVTLAPGQRLLLVSNRLLFSVTYDAPADVHVFDWRGDRLSNTGGHIQLSKPGDKDSDGTQHWIRVDRVVYSDGSHPGDFPSRTDPWPTAAAGQGSSLERIDPQSYGNDPANWRAGDPSPGNN